MTDKNYDPYYAKDGSNTAASLRDMFAAKAMNALIRTIPMQWSLMGQSEDEFHITAQSAYRMADAMLRAREK